MKRLFRVFAVAVCVISGGVFFADPAPSPGRASSPPVSSTALFSSTPTTSTLPPVPRRLEDVPNTSEYWPRCVLDIDEYCWESGSKIDGNGVEAPVNESHPFIYCHRGQGFGDTSRCATDGSYWLDLGFQKAYDYSVKFDASDAATTYRWKVRLGKFSPDILMLGDTQRTEVSGNEASGWSLEIWAKPALKAFKNGCATPSTCNESTVAESVLYSVHGYMRTLGINQSWPSVATTELRNSLRGTFISTNGMAQSWSFSSDTFYVTAIGPHFLPDGVSVSPGYVKVFLPEAYVVQQRGYSSLAEVDQEDLSVTISGKPVTAGIERQDHGLLVDTGVRHFSAPNPTLMLLPKNRAGAASAPGVLKRRSSVALSSIRSVKPSLKPRWSARGKCTIKGKRLVASATPGSCYVVVSGMKGTKRVTLLRRTYRVM